MGISYCIRPARNFSEKAVWRSVFLTIWHCILNADLTKTPSSSVTFSGFAGWVMYCNGTELHGRTLRYLTGVEPVIAHHRVWHDVRTTLLRRHFNVLTSFQRPCNVVLTSCAG